MKIRLWRVLSGRTLVRILDIQYNYWEKRVFRCKEKSPRQGEREQGKGYSCPEKRASRCKEKSPRQGEREQGKG
jgi:hypothetical protein